MASSSDSANLSSRTLYLVDIPPEQNNRFKLYDHFSKFGKVLDIDVACNGDLSASKITFETSKEAGAAFNSTTAVFNNRFIKISWNAMQANAASAPTTSVDSGQIEDTKCTYCNATFVSKCNRDRHIKRMHSGSSGIICKLCNVTFTTTTSFKKHCIVHHPNTPFANKDLIDPKQRSKNECPSLKIDESELLRIKLKLLKDKSRHTEKIHSKELKAVEKKKKRLKVQLREKEAVLVKLKQKLTATEQSMAQLKIKFKQDLQNERERVKMMQETLMAVLARSQNTNKSPSVLSQSVNGK